MSEPPKYPDDWAIYSPESEDGWPTWKHRALNAAVFAALAVVLGTVGMALWALWTHPWVIPIVAAPLLIWAFISTITHH